MTAKTRMNNLKKSYNQSQLNSSEVLSSPEFKVQDNIRSEFDMWSWIFQEISNLRIEVSRLGTLVRINNSNSPNFLNVYHAHIYSLLIPISVVINDNLWNKVYKLWVEAEKDIETYNQIRKNIPNKKIPNELIKKLDSLYRISLIVAQKGGIGFKVNLNQDFESSIERAITGG